MKLLKKILFRVILAAIVLAAAWAAYRFVSELPGRQREVATTTVRRGDVVVRAYTRGELRAVRSVTLTAPNLFGTVQVTRLAPLGAFAREGDLAIEFDDDRFGHDLSGNVRRCRDFLCGVGFRVNDAYILHVIGVEMFFQFFYWHKAPLSQGLH